MENLKHEIKDTKGCGKRCHASRLASRTARASGLTSRAPTSWAKVKLGTICSRVISGGTPSTKRPEYYGGTIPWLRTQEVDFKPIYSTELFITEDGLNNSSAKWIPENTVIVAMYGATAGRSAITKIALTTNQACCNLIIDEAQADYRFVYYSLRLRYEELEGLAKGSAQTNLNAGIIKEFEIPLPPLHVQRRIADILSAYDDLIENNRRRIAILEETARFLFQTDVVGGGWPCVPVSELIAINPKVAKPRNTIVRYVPMSALSTSGMTVDLHEIEMRSKATSVCFVNGDVLLARITPCLENGKTAYVNFLGDDEVACGSSEFIVMRGQKVSPYFTYCTARLEAFRGIAIKSMVGASGRQRVQESCFKDFSIQYPDSVALHRFDQTVKPMFQQIAFLSKQNAVLAAARDMQLPRLMKGELA